MYVTAFSIFLSENFLHRTSLTQQIFQRFVLSFRSAYYFSQENESNHFISHYAICIMDFFIMCFPSLII